MLAHGHCRKFAYNMGRQDVLASQYARFLCNRPYEFVGGSVIQYRSSNFLSCGAGDFGLAFCVDHALQIANEV
jgi:hypothetical protein